jgi:two-component system LytT family response regulator
MHLVSRVGLRDVIIPLETIDFIEADDVYAAVFADGKRYLVRTALDALERSLDASLFARIHRSYIVRLDRVREFRRTNGAELVLADGRSLPVSRRRRAVLESLLKPAITARQARNDGPSLDLMPDS